MQWFFPTIKQIVSYKKIQQGIFVDPEMIQVSHQ